jgi:uncharacterized membrane protein
MGKGSNRRPMQISQKEYDLRWEYGKGKITLEEFNKCMEELRNEKKKT